MGRSRVHINGIVAVTSAPTAVVQEPLFARTIALLKACLGTRGELVRRRLVTD